MFDVSQVALPRRPGIYIMKDSDDMVLYVGKAKNLKRRVRSYFTRTQDPKTARLVERIRDIQFVLTDTEAEAYVLEASMIKRHRPKFNIELKDQERYTYLRVTDEKYPRLVVARRTRKGKFLGKGDVYGPLRVRKLQSAHCGHAAQDRSRCAYARSCPRRCAWSTT